MKLVRNFMSKIASFFRSRSILSSFASGSELQEPYTENPSATKLYEGEFMHYFPEVKVIESIYRISAKGRFHKVHEENENVTFCGLTPPEGWSLVRGYKAVDLNAKLDFETGICLNCFFAENRYRRRNGLRKIKLEEF